MTFKLKGGKRVAHSKWAVDTDGLSWISTTPDGNNGVLNQRIVELDQGKFSAHVVHNGHPKFSKEIQELSVEQKDFDQLEAAKQWCRTRAIGIAVNHDKLLEMRPEDFRSLSVRTAGGSLSPGSVEDFGPSQRPVPSFRKRRKRD